MYLSMDEFSSYKKLNETFQETCCSIARKLRELGNIDPEYFYINQIKYWHLEGKEIAGYCMGLYEEHIRVAFPAHLVAGGPREVDTFIEAALNIHHEKLLKQQREEEKLRAEYTRLKKKFEDNAEYEKYMKLHKRFGNEDTTLDHKYDE